MTRRITMRLAALFLGFYASTGFCQGWDSRFALAGADGGIASLVEFQGNLYAVGGFRHIAGIEAPGVARWDGIGWTAVQPEPTNTVVGPAVVTPDAMYFAFHWTNPTEESTGGLLRWDGQNWQVISMPTGYRSLEGVLIADGSDVYAELFPVTNTGGPYWWRALAKWDGSHWSILALTSPVGGSALNGIAIANGNVYASGAIVLEGTESALNLGQLVGTNFVPVGGGIANAYNVLGIASDGENLFVYGSFTSVSSQPAEGFAIWNGAQWIIPSASERDGLGVTALTANGTEILASEATYDPWTERVLSQYLVRYVYTNRTVIARGDANQMDVMRRFGDGIYCTGEFRGVGDVGSGNLAVWTGLRWSRVGEGEFHGLSSHVRCLATAGGNVYAGGIFEYAGEILAGRVARWDGQKWHALGNGAEGAVMHMAARGDDLFVVYASSISQVFSNVVWWNGSVWSNISAGLSGNFTAIAADEHYVYLARKPNYTNFIISRWDGANWSDLVSGSFGNDWDGMIKTLLPAGGVLLAGGSFRAIDGIELNNIARWDGRWHALGSGVTGRAPWIPNDYPVLEVRAVLQDGCNLYVGGSFTNAGGLPAMNVARWNGSEWSALGAGLPGLASCLFGSCIFPVTSLAIVNGTLFAGGGFQTGSYDKPEGFLGRWTGAHWTNVVAGDWRRDDHTERPFYNYSYGPLHVWALASRENELYVAGNFARIGEVPSYGFGIYSNEPSSSISISRPMIEDVTRVGDLLQFHVLSEAAHIHTVEYTDCLSSAVWLSLTNFGHKLQTFDAAVTDKLTGTQARFYRVRKEHCGCR